MSGDRLRLDFDDASGILERAAPWLEDAATHAAAGDRPSPNLRGAAAQSGDHDRRIARRRAAVHSDWPASRLAAPGADRDARGVPTLRGGCRPRVLSARRRSARADGVHGQDGRAYRPDAPPADRRRRASEAADRSREILESTWRACTEKDPDHPDAEPFVADGIIANPPSYGHFHCAEALHIPLHIVFTMPWTSTSAFPHPLAHICRPGRIIRCGTGSPMASWTC